jgi:hypothetical protein
MNSNCDPMQAPDYKLPEQPVEEHFGEEHFVEKNGLAACRAEVNLCENEDSASACAEDLALVVGRNCRINIIDKYEIVRLNEELQDLRHWFEDYGHNGILFPNSVINAFAPNAFCQAA